MLLKATLYILSGFLGGGGGVVVGEKLVFLSSDWFWELMKLWKYEQPYVQSAFMNNCSSSSPKLPDGIVQQQY